MFPSVYLPFLPIPSKNQWARINKKTIRVLDVSCWLVGNIRKTYNADLSSCAQAVWSALIHPIVSPVCPSIGAPIQQSINLVIFTKLLLGAGCRVLAESQKGEQQRFTPTPDEEATVRASPAMPGLVPGLL